MNSPWRGLMVGIISFLVVVASLATLLYYAIELQDIDARNILATMAGAVMTYFGITWARDK